MVATCFLQAVGFWGDAYLGNPNVAANADCLPPPMGATTGDVLSWSTMRIAAHHVVVPAAIFGCGTPVDSTVDASLDAVAGDVGQDANGDACIESCGRPCSAPFEPSPLRAAPKGNVCSDQQIEAFYTTCGDNGDGGVSACQQFLGSNSACASCLTTSESSATWGALIETGDVLAFRANVPGCLAATSTDPTCAQNAENARACPYYFCRTVCPLPWTDQPGAWQQCLSAAAKTYCNAWTAKRCDPSDAGPTAACGGQDFHEVYTNVARVMCGIKPGDAGSD